MRPTLAALALVVAGCRIADAKAWNLKELHDENDRHRYAGALEGDIEFFFRHQVAGSLLTGSARFEDKPTVAIEDPATQCLENLVELQDFGDGDRRIAGMQVEWFARLAASDPWKLSRERAALALGRAGARLSAGMPAALPKDTVPAGPAAVSEALAGILGAARPVLERGSRASASERLDLEAACQVAHDLVLDLDGARRTLHAVVDLASAVGDRNDAGAPLLRLSEELQRRCVRQALAAALLDPEPVVRAAAVEATVQSAGPTVIDNLLAELPREGSPEVLVRLLDVVRRVGLPREAPEGSDVSAEQAREARLAALLALLDRPEGSVRVAAMRALTRVADGGPATLREEDWQSWWLARRAQDPEKRGP